MRISCRRSHVREFASGACSDAFTCHSIFSKCTSPQRRESPFEHARYFDAEWLHILIFPCRLALPDPTQTRVPLESDMI